MNFLARAVTPAVMLAMALVLAGCGADFKPGTYADGGLSYHFGEDGKGAMSGGVSGTPAFTYEVRGDQIRVQFGPDPGRAFTQVDKHTIERWDGRRFVLQSE